MISFKLFITLIYIGNVCIVISSCSDKIRESKKIAKERGQWFPDEQQNASLTALLDEMKRMAFEEKFRPVIRPNGLDVIACNHNAPGEITIVLYGRLSSESALVLAKKLSNLLEGSNVQKAHLLIEDFKVEQETNITHGLKDEMRTLFRFLVIPGKSPKALEPE